MNAKLNPELNGEVQMRRVLKTFDIFDTLIARRCIHAKEVFAEVERRSGIQGFAEFRMKAEQNVSGGEYDFADIYRAFADALNMDDAMAEALMNLEVLVELENVIPVRTMLNQLTQESVLITDMYLPEAVIRELLRHCGVQLDLPILISAHGKASGKIWQDFAAMGIQCIHHGDNQQSDGVKAREAGMRSRHASWGFLTEFEDFLLERGARNAVEALRTARLAVDVNELPAWLLNLQFNVNVPFLLTSALDLLSQVRNASIERVLFASRDGRHLQSAFEALRDQFDDMKGVSTSYWFTSRVARTQGSQAYLDYCRSQMQAGVAIVDLCGTGASLTKLMADLGVDADQCLIFLAQSVVDMNYRQRVAKGYGLSHPHAFVPVCSTFDTGSFINNALMEELNYVPEGMIRDVAKTSAGYLPLRDAIDFDGEALALVENQSRALNAYFIALRETLTQDAMEEILQAVPLIYEWILLTANNRVKELKLLELKIGVDDMSNENLTAADLKI